VKFEEGHKKVGGRQPGSANKTTKISQEAIASALEGSIEGIKVALAKLEGKPKDYIDAVTKLLPYTVPKKAELTIDGLKEYIVGRSSKD